jgi:hypothetical protein
MFDSLDFILGLRQEPVDLVPPAGAEGHDLGDVAVSGQVGSAGDAQRPVADGEQFGSVLDQHGALGLAATLLLEPRQSAVLVEHHPLLAPRLAEQTL